MNAAQAKAVLVLMVGLAGCSTTSTVTIVDAPARASAGNCRPTFFNQDRPAGAYRALAKIETNVKRNVFFGGAARLEDEAYAELRAKACAVGATGVIVNDYVESRAGEMTHVHVWATAIRLE